MSLKGSRRGENLYPLSTAGWFLGIGERLVTVLINLWTWVNIEYEDKVSFNTACLCCSKWIFTLQEAGALLSEVYLVQANHSVGDWHPDVLMHPVIKQLDTLNGRHASLGSCQITNWSFLFLLMFICPFSSPIYLPLMTLQSNVLKLTPNLLECTPSTPGLNVLLTSMKYLDAKQFTKGKVKECKGLKVSPTN